MLDSLGFSAGVLAPLWIIFWEISFWKKVQMCSKLKMASILFLFFLAAGILLYFVNIRIEFILMLCFCGFLMGLFSKIIFKNIDRGEGSLLAGALNLLMLVIMIILFICCSWLRDIWKNVLLNYDGYSIIYCILWGASFFLILITSAKNLIQLE